MDIGVFEFTFYEPDPVFVFGTTDPLQIILNNSLLLEPLSLKLVCIDGFIYLYQYCNVREIWKKELLIRRIRRAKRPVKYLDDCKNNASSECKICFNNQVCIMIHPCNHVGLCNTCCLRIFNVGFFNRRGCFELSKGFKPNKCPFCFTPVTDLTYVFIA